MKTNILLLFLIVLIISCNTRSGSKIFGQDTITYILRPHLALRSVYYYTFKRESLFKVSVENKKINKLSRSEVGTNLRITKDSIGNLLINIRYNKIHLYTKSGDKETEMDADNTPNPFSPEEQILHALKKLNITATVDSFGKIRSVKGYKKIEAVIIKNIPSDDINTKIAIQRQQRGGQHCIYDLNSP